MRYFDGRFSKTSKRGFTLAEVLISLAIFGVILTVVIPKIVTNQRNQTYNSNFQEFTGALATAYQKYQIDHDFQVSNAFGTYSLTPYLNYVGVDTASSLNVWFGSIACSGGAPCYKLHSGAIIRPRPCGISGSTSLNAVDLLYDPSGVYEAGKNDAVYIFLYRSGQITSYGYIQANTVNVCGTYNPTPSYDPSWLLW